MSTKRTLLALSVVGLGLAGTAQAEISRPECVAPAQPGGGFDLTCRVVQTGLLSQLSRPMEVTFMPGGIGAVAFNEFNSRRAQDSNGIVAFSTGSILNLISGKYGNYTLDDARWLAAAGVDYGAIIVKNDSPFQTLDDLVKAMKEDPQGLVLGAGGSVGSQDWMKAALIAKAAGVDPRSMRYAAFDGGGEALAGVLGGAIQVYTGDMAEMSAHMDGGLRILATMSDERLPAPFAEIPTAKELGYDVVWPILRGYYVGKDVPDADYQAWVDIFEKAYADPEFDKVQHEKGLYPLDKAGPEFDAMVREQAETLRTLAVEAGLISG